MIVFEKFPRLRLMFLLGCISLPVAAFLSSGDWVSTLIILPMFLFDGFIALVKAKVIELPRAEAINNLTFDLLNIFILVYSVVEIFKSLLLR